jgi:hypothetical protein
LGEGIYETLGRWESVLGEAETVTQADGGHTFFYWPESGVGVFTHPLYEGQFRRTPLPNRRVTSVVLPLQEDLHLQFLPIAGEQAIHFDRLLNLQHVASRIQEVSRVDIHPDGLCYIDLVASPLRKTVERLHYQDGEASAIEIRDDWWLSHYD